MDWHYVHLFVSQFTVVLGVVGALSVLLAWPTRRRSVWNYGLTCMVLAGVASIPTYLSALLAASSAGGAGNLNAAVLPVHVRWGTTSLWLLLGAAMLALYTLLRISRRPAPGKTVFPAWLQVLVVVAAAAAASAAVYSGEPLLGRGLLLR